MSKAKQEAITTAEYSGFQKAFDYFNEKLFAGSLPHVLVTLQRHAKARGYFSPDRFHMRGAKVTAHEIALNPDTFCEESDERILSTLAHEMVHLWQQTHGNPPRRCYHDREWAAKMREIGLQPSDTGKEGGKETGQSVTHYVIKGGPYQRAFNDLSRAGLKLHWESPTGPAAEERARANASKTKFTCEECGQNAWAKPEAVLICGSCFEDDPGEPHIMLANAA